MKKEDMQTVLDALSDERYVTRYSHIVEAITLMQAAVDAPEVTPAAVRSDIEIHLSHCFQAPYETSCKYDDADCPATPKGVAPKVEPVAWIFKPHKELLWPDEVEAKNPLELDSFMPLYAAPQERKPQEPVPLSDWQKLVDACGHYEAALYEAFPAGAYGHAFEHWNDARKLLNEREAPTGATE